MKEWPCRPSKIREFPKSVPTTKVKFCKTEKIFDFPYTAKAISAPLKTLFIGTFNQ
jgi:hypothetical protein